MEYLDDLIKNSDYIVYFEAPPGFEPGLPESESDVITNYTMGPPLLI